MNKFIFIALIISLTNGCTGHKDATETPTQLVKAEVSTPSQAVSTITKEEKTVSKEETVSQAEETASTSTLPTKEELEKVLKDFKDNANDDDIYYLKLTYVKEIDGQYVYNYYGYRATDRKDAFFFIEKNNGEYFIKKMMFQGELYGIFEYYVIDNINIALHPKFPDFANDTFVSFPDIEEDMGHISFGIYPIQRHLGTVSDTKFYIRYDGEDEMMSYTPKHIVQCGDKRITLPKDSKFFIGYDYSNLQEPSFAVIAEKRAKPKHYNDMKHRYYYDMKNLCRDIEP